MMMMMMMMMMSNKRRVRLSSSFTSSSRPEKKITFGGNVFFPILDDLKSRWWVASLSFSISQSGRETSDLQKVDVIGSLTALSKEEDQSTPNKRALLPIVVSKPKKKKKKERKTTRARALGRTAKEDRSSSGD